MTAGTWRSWWRATFTSSTSTSWVVSWTNRQRPCAFSISASAQTTWKRPEAARGLEADQCYHFDPKKIRLVAAARKRGSMDIADYPNPDMAVEIDISPPQVDRDSIYKSLQIAEIWRFDGNEVTIEQLAEDGSYVGAEMSRFLPIKAIEIRRWILEEDWSEQTAWCLRLRAWLRQIARTRQPQAGRARRERRMTDSAGGRTVSSIGAVKKTCDQGARVILRRPAATPAQSSSGGSVRCSAGGSRDSSINSFAQPDGSSKLISTTSSGHPLPRLAATAS